MYWLSLRPELSACPLLWLAELAYTSSSWPITGRGQLRSLTQYMRCSNTKYCEPHGRGADTPLMLTLYSCLDWPVCIRGEGPVHVTVRQHVPLQQYHYPVRRHAAGKMQMQLWETLIEILKFYEFDLFWCNSSTFSKCVNWYKLELYSSIMKRSFDGLEPPYLHHMKHWSTRTIDTGYYVHWSITGATNIYFILCKLQNKTKYVNDIWR